MKNGWICPPRVRRRRRDAETWPPQAEGTAGQLRGSAWTVANAAVGAVRGPRFFGGLSSAENRCMYKYIYIVVIYVCIYQLW